MARQTYYDVLDVSPYATVGEIKAAYRQLALQWHPDRNKRPNATARFREINEAYRCLIDPQVRQAYDRECGFANEEACTCHTGDCLCPPMDRFYGAIDRLSKRWDDALTLRPETLVAVFDRIDAWIRRTRQR